MSLIRSPNASRRGPGRPSTRARQNPVSEFPQQNPVAPNEKEDEAAQAKVTSFPSTQQPRSPSPQLRSRSVPTRTNTNSRNISFRSTQTTEHHSNPIPAMESRPGPSNRPEPLSIPTVSTMQRQMQQCNAKFFNPCLAFIDTRSPLPGTSSSYFCRFRSWRSDRFPRQMRDFLHRGFDRPSGIVTTDFKVFNQKRREMVWNL